MELNQMNLFNQDTTTSPFDSLKRTDGTNEWWSARDLMPLMGYSTWQKFMTPLNRAMQTAGNQGMDVEKNFNRSVKVTTTPGPNLADFEKVTERARASAANAGVVEGFSLIEEKPQGAEHARTYQDQLTGELVHTAPQVRVTAKGLDAARDLLSRMDK